MRPTHGLAGRFVLLPFELATLARLTGVLRPGAFIANSDYQLPIERAEVNPMGFPAAQTLRLDETSNSIRRVAVRVWKLNGCESVCRSMTTTPSGNKGLNLAELR